MKDGELIENKILLDKISIKIIKSFIIVLITSIIISFLTIIYFPVYSEKIILLIIFINGFNTGAIFAVSIYYNKYWKELKEKFRGELNEK